jgi:hypothetical protein
LSCADLEAVDEFVRASLFRRTSPFEVITGVGWAADVEVDEALISPATGSESR